MQCHQILHPDPQPADDGVGNLLRLGAQGAWGPPQLNPHNDPLALLARRREERYAGRTR